MKSEGSGRRGRRTAPGGAQALPADNPAEVQCGSVDDPAAPAGWVGRIISGCLPAEPVSASVGPRSAHSDDSTPVPPVAHPQPVDIDLTPAVGVTCCPPAVAAQILGRLANGESLRAICRDNAMPARMTVLGWIERDEAFAAAYARARDHQADALDDEMAEVMSEVKAGRMDPAAARVWLSGAQWRASKLAPRRYGDRLALQHSGGVATAPVEVTDEHAARVAQAILDGMKDAN